MKLFHLSDLHIGKIVNGYEMWEDQRYVFDQILAYVREEQPDAVMIAGDIYDKAVPSAKAVTEFDEFLTELADSGTIILIISGNHDSAERLDFASSIMKKQNIYMKGTYGGEAMKVTMQDKWGDVNFYLMPFVKPANVKNTLSDLTEEPEKESAALTYTEAMQQAVAAMQVDPGKRNVLIAHQFVVGAMRCDSEEISVGGIDQVEADVFRDFDYVALGHIHSPQNVGSEHIRYCGTPLKYSFSEAGQQKSVTVVELLEKGNLRIREIPLKPLRDMRKLKGTYMEITSLSSYQDTNTEDYVQITLTDEEDIVDGMQKLRTVYPNLMRLEYDNRRTRENQEIAGTETVKRKSELEYFEEFFELQNNQPMNEEQRKYSEDLIRKIQEVKQ